MIRAALTGGIATGKSYCLARFAAHGVPTADADLLARHAVAPGTSGLAEVVARFGPAMLLPDGTLDRAALARVVFQESRARRDLEGIVHPRVYRAIREWFGGLPATTGVAIADVPLLYETGHEHDFDCVIVAACGRPEQLRRLMERDGFKPEEAQARLDAQAPIEEKVRRADYVIDTGGSFADTDTAVEQVLRELHGRSGPAASLRR